MRNRTYKKKNKKANRRRVIIILLAVLLIVASLAYLYKFFFSDTQDDKVAQSSSVLSNPNYVYYHHSKSFRCPLINGHYRDIFHDRNDIQMEAAIRNGIKEPLSNRVESYQNYGLVEIVPNQYYSISELSHSVPYLVPKARIMANTIGKCFQDLIEEKYPGTIYKIHITSMLRTQSDIQRLVRRNRWATENSCHRFGTTIDISYKNYDKISGKDLSAYELKDFLAQALFELREQKICYVLYERRNCFHITVNNINLDTCVATTAPKDEKIEIPEMEKPKNKPVIKRKPSKPKARPQIPQNTKNEDSQIQKNISRFDDKPSMVQ